MEEVVELLVGLLMAAAVLVLLARKLNIAYPILLVLGGLGLGFVPGLPAVPLDPQIIFLCVLPPLLFPAAMFTSWRDFRANLRPIVLLAVGLVLFTTAAVAAVVHYLTGLPLAAGFVLGSIISPPDAVAASAVVRRLGVPRAIVAILEGESLVNDATALVAYSFAVTAVKTGSFSLAGAGIAFGTVSAGGVLIGLAIGWVASWLQQHVDDAPVEITFSLLTPFVAYLVADRVGVSGVLAVVTSGLFLGWRLPEITSSGTRLQGGPVWSMIEFLLNGLVFILLGLQLPGILKGLDGHSLGGTFRDAAIISGLVIIVRVAWVFPATYLPGWLFTRCRANNPCPSWRHVAVVAWTGMRGVVSLAAALSLPTATANGAPFPGRSLILFVTFAVILATLIVQGLSLPAIIRLLKIKDDKAAEKEELNARLQANQSALLRLREIAGRDPAKAGALNRLKLEYEDRIQQLEAYELDRAESSRSFFSSVYETLSFEALKAEREVILRLRNQETISDEVLRRIQRDIDLAEARMQRPVLS